MSNVVETPCLEVVQEEEVMTKEEVLNMLVAIGVNSCSRSYEASHKELRVSFLNMSLKDIAPTWDHLDDGIKVAVVSAHSDEFKAWINGR